MNVAFSYLLEKEEVFQRIVDKYGLPVVPSRPEGFQTLCKLILEQQVSIESAKACFQKIENLLKIVSPEIIFKSSNEELRSCGVSRQKINYLYHLSESILENRIQLETFSQKTDKEVRDELIKIKGIGHWTIDVYLMFSLQSKDVIPLGDIAVVNTIKELFDCHEKEEMERLTQKWMPYRSMATFLLWHHYLSKRNRKVIF
ncbi:MAG TPA: DNA-3-methyladenine glycosylase 2 family protein [Flavobacterium lutivivi]|nr:DNA-3-methyladenine glycosylase 2 family protein [Flavobacterium lutivivi]